MTDLADEAEHKMDPSLHRLLFFSDGVFAIAITLLSIELHAPHGWDGTLVDLWRKGWPMLSSFAVSFLVIGVFWNAHRRIFTQITRYSAGVFITNLMLLGCVALMPFATSLIYSQGALGQTLIIYLSLVAAAGVMQGLVYGYAAFINDSLIPTPLAKRVLTFVSMIVLPTMVCGAALMLTGNGSMLGIAASAVLAVALVVLRRAVDRKLTPA